MSKSEIVVYTLYCQSFLNQRQPQSRSLSFPLCVKPITSNSNMSINTDASTGSHSTSDTSSTGTLNIILGSLSSKKRSEISLHESTGSTRSVNQPSPGNEFTSFDDSLPAASPASPQPIYPPLVGPTESMGDLSSPKKVYEPKMNIIIDSFGDQTKEQYNIEDSLHFDHQGKIAKSVGPSGPPSPGSACSTNARPISARHSKKQKR